MKKLLLFIAVILTISAFSSCGSDGNSWTDYKEWRETNNAWVKEQAEMKNPDGTPYYKRLQPAWYPESGVLIHYFNDRKLTEGNLSPLLTSKVKVKYVGRLYNGVGFDSTTVGSDSVREFSLTGVVAGWQIALTDMRVGDTAKIVLPYAQAYGVNGNTGISPYSALQFNIRLVDIVSYEIP